MTPWKIFWIAGLVTDPSVEAKLRLRKGFSLTELKQEFVGNPQLHGIYERHPEHGGRWVVTKMYEPLPRVTLILVPHIPEYDIWKVVTVFKSRNPNQVGR